MCFSQYIETERALASLQLNKHTSWHTNRSYTKLRISPFQHHSFHLTQTFLFILLLWYILLCYCLRVYLNTFVYGTNRWSSLLLIEDDGADKCDSIKCAENRTNIRKNNDTKHCQWIVLYTLIDRIQYNWYIFRLDLMFVFLGRFLFLNVCVVFHFRFDFCTTK